MKAIVLMLLTLLMLGCTSKPVLNIQGEMIPNTASGHALSSQEIEKAIIVAAKRRGWVARVVKPGLIEARLVVRDVRAAIEIPYGADRYSIQYKNSENLNYTGEKIHRNYNNWITKLSQTINDELNNRGYLKE